MRTAQASTQERFLSLWERYAIAAQQAGLVRLRIDDHDLDAPYLEVNRQRLVNFGSCAYLGLNTDQRLKEAAKSAIDRYGTVYSSSAIYTSVGLYTELEQSLRQIIGAPVLVATTTTLAHLAAIPTLVGEEDAVLVDTQAHASVHLASRVVASVGIPVLPVPHNDMAALESMLTETSPEYRHVWYLADGIYSMFGDGAPVAAFERLLHQFPNLFMYVDDAHSFGWKGRHGSGWILDQMSWHPRLVLAFSLAKSWGSGGAALAFPNEEMASRVLTVGSTFTFSGPLHPAELGASVAAAEIHLSDEHRERQAALLRQIEFVRSALDDANLPVMPTDNTPLWFVPVGSYSKAADLCRNMIDRGFYLNLASIPAVPMKFSGVRFTNTLYNSDAQILAMVEALRANIPTSEVVIDLTERIAR
ncbi:MAG: aminotransferase class I/II-fold pyridoxal phosphate-dependent enzyme [Acidimicrobiia bacterium]